jgi:hypothetical protein
MALLPQANGPSSGCDEVMEVGISKPESLGAPQRKKAISGGCVMTLQHTCYDLHDDRGNFVFEMSGQRESNPL